MTWTHVVTGGPWPERIGKRCRIVPPQTDTYPWHGRDRSEEVVLIEDDPFGYHARDPQHSLTCTCVWSCAMNRNDIAPVL